MKNFTKIIAILTLICLGSCADEELFSNEKIVNEEQGNESPTLLSKVVKSALAPNIIKDQIVIKYKKENPNIKYKDSIKGALKEKYYFDIRKIETCNCDDDSVELWTIVPTDSRFIGIEDLVAEFKKKSGEAGVEGDHNFWIYVQDHRINMVQTPPISEWVVAHNSPDAVNIAVLDTGVAYDFFDEPFLYKSVDADNCENTEISGWDFVNKDYDSMDDHGHGTATTKIIMDNLDREDILYQILPVKVFDHEGKGTYFNVVCGLQYLAKKNITLQVNASFGFYDLKNQSIFETILNDASDRLFLITSSGNKGVNTDKIGNNHFPSGYNLPNIISVAGYQYVAEYAFAHPEESTQVVNGFALDVLSNFGKQNVDLAARFSHRLIFNGKTYYFNGTSYACAEVTARAAAIYYNEFTRPSHLKEEILKTAYTSSSFGGKIYSNKILLSGLYRSSVPMRP